MRQITTPSWPNDISSEADNLIFKNRAQNIECSFGCVAPSCWKQILPISSSSILWTKIRSTWPDNDRHWLWRPLLAHFQRKMVQLCLWTKILTKQWIVFNVCVRVFCAPNMTILIVYIPAKIKRAPCQNHHLL